MTQHNEPAARPIRSAHTPGRWFPVGSMVEHADDKVADICTCDPRNFGQGHLARSHSEIYANSWLIAAAPGMLIALKASLKHFRHPTSAEARTRTLIVAAIANAEGGKAPARQTPSEDDFAKRALQRAIKFLDDEAEQRTAAGSDMSDYATEPKDIGTDLRTVLHNLKGGAA